MSDSPFVEDVGSDSPGAVGDGEVGGLRSLYLKAWWSINYGSKEK